MIKRHLVIGRALLLILSAAACGGQPSTPQLPPPPTQAPQIQPTTAPPPTVAPEATPMPAAMQELITAAQQEGQLNVIALPRDWMNYGTIIDTFASRYHIIVNPLSPDASSGDELAAIKSTQTKNRDSAPDVIDVGLPFAVQAKAAKLLQPYKVSTWSTIPSNVKDADGAWYGDYYGLIVFELNPQVVPSMPQDWADLLEPGFKVARPGNPATAYRGMMAVYSASVANGGSLEDTLPGLRFFQKLNKEAGLLSVPPSGDNVASGQAPVVLNWDYLALADAAAYPAAIKVVVPKSGNVAGLYAQAISVYAPHPYAARLWMEFLYSDEGQLLLMQGLGHPVRFADLSGRGVIPPELLAKLLPPEPYLSALFPNPEQITAADQSILGSWNSYVP